MAKAYQDTFTRGAANLAGSTSSDGLFTWAVPDGTLSTNGTGIAFTSNFGTGMASADCDTDVMYVEIDFSFSTGAPAFWLDVSANGTYPGSGAHGYEFSYASGSVFIHAIASGAFNQLATASHTVSNGTYRAERNGSTLTFYRNSVSILTTTDSSEPTGAGNRRGGAGGDSGGATGIVFAEFRYGDIVAGGGTTDSGIKSSRVGRPAPFKPMGDGFRPGPYRGWR